MKEWKEGCVGGGGFFLFPSRQALVHLGSWMSASGPILVTYCVFLSLYTASVFKTGTQQSQNKGQRGVGRGGGGEGVEREDTSLLYRWSNSTSGMMLLSLGKPSAQQEDDSINEVYELRGRRGRGGGCPVHCFLLQCDGGFMKVLCCIILGKLDLGMRNLGFS